MSRSPWLAPLAVLLAVCMFFTGCVGSRPHSFDSSVAVHVRDDGSVEKVHGGGEALAALFLLGCFVIVGAAILDVLLLPCTCPCHHPFCCTEEVVYVFYR